MTAHHAPGPTLRIPAADGTITSYTMREPGEFDPHPGLFCSRDVFAAPHVVADVRADYTPGIRPPVDWDATIAFREHLWSFGIGVAEAMDTSERGNDGLRWDQAEELIRRGITAANAVGGAIVCGVGTDHIDRTSATVSTVRDAYLHQLEAVERYGGAAVIRASHALVGIARSADEYLSVYGSVLSQCSKPAIVHWLGTDFDPSLQGYWGHAQPVDALATVVRLASDNTGHMRGIKFSVLDPEMESELRRQLPPQVKVYTGDDFGYTDLLLGDGQHHSHALLGVLDPLAPIASQAFAQLDKGHGDDFATIMNSTIPLATKMFEPPSSYYKTGVVFLAWLSGHQDHFRMVTGREGLRSVQHLTDLFVLSDQLGLFPDPAMAAHRMQSMLAVSGIE